MLCGQVRMPKYVTREPQMQKDAKSLDLQVHKCQLRRR